MSPGNAGVRRLAPLCASVAMAAVLLLPAAAAAAQFTFVTDPHAATDTPPFIQLLGVNNAGMITGYTGIGAVVNNVLVDPNRGFILNLPNSFTNLNPNFNAATCLTCQTQVFGIDAAGNETAGFYIDAAGVTHGFVDQGNGPSATNVDDGGAGVTVNQLLGINAAGTQAAGFFTNLLGNDVPYVYNVGSATFTTLPALPAGDSIQATGVNNNGLVSGFDMTTGSSFLYNLHTNTFITFSAGPAAAFTQALGLNDLGQAVGTYTDGAGVAHGFFYNNGMVTTLDPTGSTATTLNGINDLDETVGFYTDGANNTIGLTTSVAPEPAALLLLLAGLAGIAAIRRGETSRRVP